MVNHPNRSKRTDHDSIDAVVARLAKAFSQRRLRQEAEFTPVKDLAAAARHLGQGARMAEGRTMLVGKIEIGLMARAALASQ